ncbi:MAG: 2-oxo acid dehydrogenase subunit E2 [Gammaproteobacteria bacterium]|nr:2-oxo acid dehydrogenase subunit E2 [Gammaproteobacteria bacterium]
MGAFTFKLPDLGEGTVESEIVQWRVQPGDHIEAEQPLVDMMTDKATVEITSPVSGKVVKLAGQAGDMIAVGAELVVFETGEETRSDGARTDSMILAPAALTAAGGSVAAMPAGPVNALSRKAQASPAVRKRARETGVDLTTVKGSGPSGRVTRADLEAIALAGSAAPAASEQTGVKRIGQHEIRLIGLRRKIAEQMTVAHRHIPHFTYVEEVDVTELDALRKHLNEIHGATRPKLTFLPFFMRAIVRVLMNFPQCNAHFDDGKGIITRFEAVHMGIATQTAQGLMVPVVRHAEALDLWQSAAGIARVVDAARAGKAAREELAGSTITLTSLGALGGIVSTPIINHPEVAIIGVNKVQQRPVFQDRVVVPRLLMNLSSSFDHRVVDGHDAARMIQALKSLLEHPATQFI